jgi:hypothetical protein
MTMLPKKGSLRNHISLFVAKSGPVTMQEICQHFSIYQAKRIEGAVHSLRHYNTFTMEGKKYTIGAGARAHYGLEKPTKNTGPIQMVAIQKIAPAPMKPLSTKNMAHLALRREPIRDISFKVASGATYNPTWGY